MMIKKYFVLLVMAIAITVDLSAQSVQVEVDIDDSDMFSDLGGGIDSDNRIYLGLKAGANFSSMNGLSNDFNLYPENGIGFHAGLVTGVRFGRWTPKADGGSGRFGTQLEVLYSQRTINMDKNESLNFSCFEIPILAQYYVTRNIFIELGPTFAGVISASPDEIKSSNVTIATGEIKGFDVMLTGGVGYKHTSGFMASARYNYGMSELAENFTGKISTITISVGWIFNLNK